MCPFQKDYPVWPAISGWYINENLGLRKRNLRSLYVDPFTKWHPSYSEPRPSHWAWDDGSTAAMGLGFSLEDDDIQFQTQEGKSHNHHDESGSTGKRNRTADLVSLCFRSGVCCSYIWGELFGGKYSCTCSSRKVGPISSMMNMCSGSRQSSNIVNWHPRGLQNVAQFRFRLMSSALQDGACRLCFKNTFSCSE